MRDSSRHYGTPYGNFPLWYRLIVSLSGNLIFETAPVGAMIWFTGILSTGPASLVALVAAGGLAVVDLIEDNTTQGKYRDGMMYILRNQTQDIQSLRLQLKEPEHVLIARYIKKGKPNEVFVGDRKNPHPGIPTKMIKSLTEVQKLADREGGDAVILFFGRQL